MSYEEELKTVSEYLVSFSEGKKVDGWVSTVTDAGSNRRYVHTDVVVQREGSGNVFKFSVKKTKRTGEREFSTITSEVVSQVSTEKTEEFREYVDKNVNVLSDYENWKTIKANIKKADQTLITGNGFELSEELRTIEEKIKDYKEEDYKTLITEYSLALAEKAVGYLIADDFKKKGIEDLKSFKKQVDISLKAKQLESANFRKFVKDVMILSKTRKIETDLGSIYLSEQNSVEIDDIKKVPDEFKIGTITITAPITELDKVAKKLKDFEFSYDRENFKVNEKEVEAKINDIDWAHIKRDVKIGIRKKGGKKDEASTD